MRHQTRVSFSVTPSWRSTPPKAGQERRGRPENQAQDIFGAWYHLEEICPWGVMKNWRPSMKGTKEWAFEWPGRAELVQGLGRHKSRARVRTKALVNERFSPAVKSEK